MTAAFFVAVLVALWLLLWGSLTVANVLSGLAVAAIVVVILPDSVAGDRRPSFRPVAAARLFARIIVDFVGANLVVAREIVTPTSAVNTGVIEVPMPHASDTVLTFVAGVLALSPGILPLEVLKDPGAIYVHVLHLDDVDRVRADLQRLAVLAVRAFGTAEAIAAMDETIAAHGEAPS